MPTYYRGLWLWPDAGQWSTLYSRYEEEVGAAIARHLKCGAVFWDVGAHVGWFSLYAARIVGKDGAVVAFEPSPDVFALLQRNVPPEVEVVACAVGARNGSASFASQGTSSAASLIERVTRINAAHHPGEPIQQAEVSIMTLDSALESGRRSPDILKIDVEGYELEVLRGARSLLASCKPAIVAEIHPLQLQLSGGSEAMLFEELEQARYRHAVIHRNPNTVYTILAAAAGGAAA